MWPPSGLVRVFPSSLAHFGSVRALMMVGKFGTEFFGAGIPRTSPASEALILAKPLFSSFSPGWLVILERHPSLSSKTGSHVEHGDTSVSCAYRTPKHGLFIGPVSARWQLHTAALLLDLECWQNRVSPLPTRRVSGPFVTSVATDRKPPWASKPGAYQ